MISFYFDEMMSRLVAETLQKHGYSVLMAFDAGMIDKDDDSEHLPFAAARGLVLVTMDRPFAGHALAIGDHSGVISWTGEQNNFGQQISALSAFADTHVPEDVKGQVFWLKEE